MNSSDETDLMPTLFIGHGSPMNAIEDNKFTRGWEKIIREIPQPTAILCVSAHWFIPDTQVGVMESPRTIHDFYGFSQELYAQQYPAPGAPDLGRRVRNLTNSTEITLDSKWGLDHGAQSVLKKMYPEANVPTTQLSIDNTKSPIQHYEIAKQLTKLRNEGILIFGSGNLVHNLRRLRFDDLDFSYDWVREFDEKMVDFLLAGNHDGLIEYSKLGELARLVHPTPDHFLPIFYTLGASSISEEVTIFNQEYMTGSISMTSVKLG